MSNEQQPLEGKELLDKLKEIKHLPPPQKAIACGYFSGTPDKPRALSSQFHMALLKAANIDLSSTSTPKRGRIASTEGTVQKSGAIAIGAVHIKQLGLNPGDKYVLEIGKNQIKVIPQLEEPPARLLRAV